MTGHNAHSRAYNRSMVLLCPVDDGATFSCEPGGPGLMLLLVLLELGAASAPADPRAARPDERVARGGILRDLVNNFPGR